MNTEQVTVMSVGFSDDERDERVATLLRDGVVGLPGAFDVGWVDRLGAEVMAAFEQARDRPGGAVSRGPQRWYVELHPEQLSGFADLAAHPVDRCDGEQCPRSRLRDRRGGLRRPVRRRGRPAVAS